MPRISELEQIKNEALVKLYSIQKIIDGRTFTAFLRKIYRANRKDTATKLRDQIFDISSVKQTIGVQSAKKVTSSMIKESIKIKKETVTPKNEKITPSIKNEKIRASTIAAKEDPPKILYKFVVEVRKTTLHFPEKGHDWPKKPIEEKQLVSSKTGPFEMTSRGVRVGIIKNVAHGKIFPPPKRPYRLEDFTYDEVVEDIYFVDGIGVRQTHLFKDSEQSWLGLKAAPQIYVDIGTFLKKCFNNVVHHYNYLVVTEPEGVIKVNQGLEELGKTTKFSMMMRNSVILKDCWLRYANDISSKAYDKTENICVYYQLAHFLLNPTSGRPTEFINKERVSEESIYNFLKKSFPSLQMKDGVSTEMVDLIGRETQRNVYAYDFSDKCFFNSTENNKNRHYCPIIYYMGNGHMYLINTKPAFKSIIERNKANETTILNHNIEVKPKETKNVIVKHITVFDGITCDSESCYELEKGVYLLKRKSICNDVIKFIEHNHIIPRVKTKKNSIVSMSFLNAKNEEVIIACDVNYGGRGIVYENLKNVATNNMIDYVNEGIGAVVSRIVCKQKKQNREYLDEKSRMSLIETFGKKCASCNLESEVFEIDHITPLCAGGSNEVDNLQPLCPDCHHKKTEEERESGYYEEDEYEHKEASTFNTNVFKNVISTDSFKTWQFVERTAEDSNISSVKKIDMNKCRRNLLYYSKYEFPVFSVMDTVLPFLPTDNIKVGYYYVETENIFPFRGSGWYSHPLIEIGLRDQLINKTDIKFKLESSQKLPSDHFKTNIEKLLEAFSSEPTLQKVCINTYIGLMGKFNYEKSKVKFTTCKYEAANLLCEQSTFIISHHLGENKILYQSCQSQESIMDSTMYPVYTQILQMEAMHLYETEKIIQSYGGIVLDRNTDAIRFVESNPIDISQYFWDDEKLVQKYKWEEPKELFAETKPRMKRLPDDNLSDAFILNWNIEYDYETDVSTKVKEIIDKNISLHVDGIAGTGKSFFVSKFIEELNNRGLKYIAFSPTNKGARVIDGITIDSKYYALKKSKAAFNQFKKMDYIIIDEVSMMQERFFNLFITIKRVSPNTKFIVSGDFAQLLPVNDSWVGDYKNSAGTFDICGGNRLQLTINRRSDEELFELEKSCIAGIPVDITRFPLYEKTYLNIAYKHTTRKRVNQECLERFLKEEADDEDKKLFIPADPRNPKTQDVTLTIGVPVVCHKSRNHKKKKLDGNGFLNSERFEVQYIKDDIITLVGKGDREVQIRANEFHKYFYIGFCITVHTSQGDTFREKYTIYDWDFFYFCERAKYVAVSRATSINNIQIYA